jgi:hypothetical protein
LDASSWTPSHSYEMFESPVLGRASGANRAAAHFYSGNTAATLLNKASRVSKYNAEF